MTEIQIDQLFWYLKFLCMAVTFNSSFVFFLVLIFAKNQRNII